MRAEVTGIGGEATRLPVNEGISVNGHPGITITIIEETTPTPGAEEYEHNGLFIS